MTPIFQIGDKVFYAGFKNTPHWVTCPDCMGNRTLTVILGTGEHVKIDCTGCSRGYEGSRGKIEQYDFLKEVVERTICGVRNEVTHDGHKVEYVFEGGYYSSHENVFRTADEAELRAEFLAKQHTEEENKRMMAKTKDSRSWAWNATYHRGCIRSAEKELAHHRAKLEIASEKLKEKVLPE